MSVFTEGPYGRLAVMLNTLSSLNIEIIIIIITSGEHYENTSMQHTAIFHARKNDNFHSKSFDYFLIFAQNIDCGYTLEPPQ